jgi:hypothetical protein
MEEPEDWIVVKTYAQDGKQGCLILPRCLFLVDRKEWEGFKEHLNKYSCVYTPEYENKIDLWKLYTEAKIIHADESVKNFVLEHGDDIALNYLQKGVRIAKNKSNLEMIFNKLAIFRDLINSFPELEWEAPCFNDFNMHKYPTVEEWTLPIDEDQVDKCKRRNEGWLENEIIFQSKELTMICETEEIYYTIDFNGLYFKITIPDDVCLWNPKIVVEAIAADDKDLILRFKPVNYWIMWSEKLKRTKNWTNLYVNNKKKCYPNSFLGGFLGSLTDDNYREELLDFFWDYTFLYRGDNPQGLVSKFKDFYVPYEKKSETCYYGCYYVLEDQKDFDGFKKLTGNDLLFFKKMCHSYKVVVKEDDEDKDTLFVFDNWGDLCLSLEDSDSPDFGKCLNPEQLQIIHQEWLEKGHKCNDEKHDGFNLTILGLHFSRDRKLAERIESDI